MPFGVLLTHLFGIMCLLCLCLDCPRSLMLPQAMPIICTPAFLAASSSVFPQAKCLIFMLFKSFQLLGNFCQLLLLSLGFHVLL